MNVARKTYSFLCKGGSIAEGVCAVTAKRGVVVRDLPQIAAFTAEVDEDSIGALRATGLFRRIAEQAPARRAELAISVNDPYYSEQWLFPNTRLDQVWTPSAGSGVKIAQIDVGFRLDHPDFVGLDASSIDPIDGSNPASGGAHGSWVLGVMAAQPNNGIGLIGVAPAATYKCVLMGSDSVVVPADQAAALIYAGDWGADIINASTLLFDDPLVHEAVKYARERGALIVAGAGNDQTETYIGHYDPSLIFVGGHNSSYSRVWTWGNHLDISAPAVSIRTTGAGSGYTNIGGTSISTPIVAGICALIKQSRPELSHIDIAEIVRQSANWQSISGKTQGWDKYYGWGAVDAQAALALAATWEPLGSEGPKVALVYPVDGQHVTVGEKLTIQVVSSDDSAVASIEVFVDEQSIASADDVSMFSSEWTPTSRDGHVIRAVVVDDVGFMEEETASVFPSLGVYEATGGAPEVVVPLTNTQNYQVRARFKNSVGDGPWSDWAPFSAESVVPDPPGVLIPILDGGNYSIFYTPSNNNATHEYKIDDGSWAAAASPLVIPIPAGSEVTIYLRGTNSAGTSESTSLLVAGDGTEPLPAGPKIFYVIYPSNLADPTAEQIKAGQDVNGNAAVKHGVELASDTDGEQIFEQVASGLTPGTSYKIAFVWSDT